MTSLFALPELIRQQQEQDDEEKSVAGKAVAASLENRVRTTGAMDPNEFQTRFREGISPAREVLANMMAGVSSKMLGSTFKPVRQRMLEEYTKQKQVQQTEERMLLMDQQKQVAEQRMRDIAAQASQDRNAALREKNRAALANEAFKAGDQKMAEAILALKEDEFDARREAIAADIRLKGARTTDIQERTTNIVDATQKILRDQGWDPSSPDYPEAYEKQLGALRALDKLGKFAPQGRAPGTGVQVDKQKNAYGETEFFRIDKNNNTITNFNTGRPLVQKDWTSKEIDDAAAQVGAVSTATNIAQLITQHPEALRSPAQMFSSMMPDTGEFLQVRNAKEQQLGAALNDFLFAKIKAVSGVQFSDAERKAQAKSNPNAVDTPLNALSKLSSYTVWQTVDHARKVLNLSDPNTVFDNGFVRELLSKRLLDLASQGRIQEFKMPSYQQILEIAAQKKGQKLVFDAQGRLRGVQ